VLLVLTSLKWLALLKTFRGGKSAGAGSLANIKNQKEIGNTMKNVTKMLALALVATASAFAVDPTFAGPLATQQEALNTSITTVGQVAGTALLIAGGAALVSVIIKYVRRAGK